MTDWERLGGEEGVRVLVEALVDRFRADFIIGFLFEGRDRDRIVQHELELASVHLGGPLRYQGRSLASVHKPLRINNGHFRRRLAILTHELRGREVPEDVIEAWVGHDRKLEPVITDGLECVDPPDDS